MNRRELLREMSRVQATWVNRNTPGTGDVNIAVEDEQEYLTKIVAVFERAREDVRRKRGRSVTALQASAAIDALLAGFDRDQPRDRKGRWSDREADLPSTPSAPAKAPVAKRRPKPEPAKVMTPEATLAAAPKALDAEKGRSPSKSQTAALERYRGSDFAEINAHLRGQAEGKRPAWVDKTVAEIDAAHADSKLTEDVVVYRGIGNVEKVFGAASKKNLTGAEWIDDAPQSATADPDIADRFQRSEGAGKRTDALLIVRVPAGTGAIQLSDERYEAEMLLERKLRTRVISDTGPWRRGQKKPRTIEVEVVPA